jgi:hypothetical protein
MALSFLDLSARRGGWSAPRPGRFTPWKDPVPIVQEAGWAPGPVWMGAKNRTPLGFNPWTVQTVVSRYTDCATRPIVAYVRFRIILIELKKVLIQELRSFFAQQDYHSSTEINCTKNCGCESLTFLLNTYLLHGAESFLRS